VDSDDAGSSVLNIEGRAPSLDTVGIVLKQDSIAVKTARSSSMTTTSGVFQWFGDINPRLHIS
jgi:hypothetical protein